MQYNPNTNLINKFLLDYILQMMRSFFFPLVAFKVIILEEMRPVSKIRVSVRKVLLAPTTSVLVHTCNSTTQEAEAGLPPVLGQPELTENSRPDVQW